MPSSKPTPLEPGQRFGKLTAVRLVEPPVRHREREWIFRCDCGAELALKPTTVRSSLRRLGWASCVPCVQAVGGWRVVIAAFRRPSATCFPPRQP